MTSKLKQTVYRNLFSPGLEATIKKHAGWTVAQFLSVDWDAYDIVFRSYSKSRRISLCNSIHGLWHIGAQQVLFGMDTDGLCQCCNEALETISHVFQCPLPLARQHSQDKLQHLERLLLRSALAKPI